MAHAPPILQQMRKIGHTVFATGSYNLNIIGVRSPQRAANAFDDELHLVYLDHRKLWVDLCFRCTTDPGTYWLEHPMKVQGTAILIPGQYRGAYRIGQHKGYPALVQHRPVKVYRDSTRDEVLDMDPSSTQKGMYYINIHHAGTDSQKVNKWSAGCQVLSNLAEWDVFMSVIRRSAQTYGDTFTYTLIDQ